MLTSRQKRETMSRGKRYNQRNTEKQPNMNLKFKTGNGKPSCCDRIMLLEQEDIPKVIILANEKGMQNKERNRIVLSNCDPLGYDLGLDSIQFIKSGKIETFKNGNEVEICPGETLIVKTSEKVKLPNDVFAIGSPKMGLLIRGLWAHGGKTEPGFEDHLTLGFHHVGSEVIKLKKNDRIFHLSFFKVVRETYHERNGRAPQFDQPKESPLDQINPLIENQMEKIKEFDGLGIYRVCKLLRLEQRKINLLKKFLVFQFAISFGFLGILIFGGIVALYYYSMLQPSILWLWTTIVALLNLKGFLFIALISWIGYLLSKPVKNITKEMRELDYCNSSVEIKDETQKT